MVGVLYYLLYWVWASLALLPSDREWAGQTKPPRICDLMIGT